MYLKLFLGLVRFLGLGLVLSAVVIFYFFGKQFVPLFEDLLAGEVDAFLIFFIFGTFFLGIPALIWVGFRLMSLLSFSKTWVSYLALPATAGLILVYNLDTISAMDKLMTSVVTYLLLYLVVKLVLLYLHKHVYTPISHDSLRHVGVEKTNKPDKRFLRRTIIIVVLSTLLVAHPADIATTLRMLISPMAQLVDTLSTHFLN